MTTWEEMIILNHGAILILKLKETQLDRTIWDLNNTYSNLKEIVGALE